ncbi:MAG: transposase, partial [Candidatus Methanofastidiosia archaeon]
MVEPKAGKRHTVVREKRTYKEYSLCMKYLVNSYSEADNIILIQDNLNTHTEKSLRKVFGKEKARKIMEKLEFHYT